MRAALEVDGLVKRYGAHTALHGVSLEVGEGELVGLLGPNGAGKSTLTKVACGLVRATEGSVRVAGHPAGSPAARSAQGYLAELFRFPGWATADEVMVLHQRLAGSTGGGAERADLLGLVGLADARERRVEAMSKGMQQRLGIAQALVGTPRLLLLDEPTSALDPAGRRTVRDLLVEVRQRGVAVLLNTHLLSEVELVCDRVVIIDRGNVVTRGPARRARPPARRRGRDRRRDPRSIAGAGREDAPRIVAELVARASGSTACRCSPPRSRTSTSTRSAAPRPRGRADEDALEGRAVVAAHALRESLRRRVFLVVLGLTVAFGGLVRVGRRRAVLRRRRVRRRTRSSTPRRSRARRSSALRCSARSSSASSSRSS
jgi:ABC-2 type transport system ATP-binding protein